MLLLLQLIALAEFFYNSNFYLFHNPNINDLRRYNNFAYAKYIITRAIYIICILYVNT